MTQLSFIDLVESAPIVVVLLEFYVILALVAVVVAVWIFERSRRARLRTAARELQDILALTADLIKHGSKNNLDVVNARIEQWDLSYSSDVGAPLPRLTSDSHHSTDLHPSAVAQPK